MASIPQVATAMSTVLNESAERAARSTGLVRRVRAILTPLSGSGFTATAPRSMAVGSYNLLVISAGQSSTLPNAFNILSSEGPQLTQIAPNSGINDRAIEIQITDDLPDERVGSVPVAPVPQTNSQRIFLPLIRR